MRSGWKLIPIERSVMRRAFSLKLKTVDALKTWAKGTKVTSNLLDKNLQVYNGTKFVEIFVKREMLNLFLGGFVLTKRITSDIHIKTKRNKKGRLNKHKKK